MKITKIFTAFLLGFVAIQAQGFSDNEKITALFISSLKGDYIGQGKTTAYFEGIDGKFGIQSNYNNGISINYSSTKKEDPYYYGDNWHIEFSAPDKQPLQVRIYPNATRFPFNKNDVPGFAFSGCGRGCNNLYQS